MSWFVWLLYGLWFTVLEVDGVRPAELRITPRYPKHGSNVTLTCVYKAQLSHVTTIRWFKGNDLMLVYGRSHFTPIQIFSVRGVNIDVDQTNGSQIALTHVDSRANGNYTCEVTTLMSHQPSFIGFDNLEITGSGLKALNLRISPEIVQRGNDATLECEYDLYDTPLYSVKWYRGRHEFYRYSPTESPSTKIFPFAGINVDLTRSNESQVVLTKVSFGLSGNFSCEVTADAPSFATSIVSNIMEVVALPPWAPRLHTEQVYYTPGDILRANCTTPPSRPPAEITFYLNEVMIHTDKAKVYQRNDSLKWTELSLEMQLLPMHYESNLPVLKCEARIKELYRDVSELVLYTGNGHPKIERVTFPGSQSMKVDSISCLVIKLVLIIYFINSYILKINT